MDEFDSSRYRQAVDLEDQAYTLWLNAKVARAVADPRPSVAHDVAMARITERIAARPSENDRVPGLS